MDLVQPSIPLSAGAASGRTENKTTKSEMMLEKRSAQGTIQRLIAGPTPASLVNDGKAQTLMHRSALGSSAATAAARARAGE